MTRKRSRRLNKKESNLSADEIIQEYRRPKPKVEKTVQKAGGSSKLFLYAGLVIAIFLVGMFGGFFSGDNGSIFTNNSQNQGNNGGQLFGSYTEDVDMSGITITTYRTATCGCCHNFIGYMENLGASVVDNVVTQSELDNKKLSLGIEESEFACHTSIIGNYYVEGHVPAFAIKKLVTESPSIDGIGIPGMPSGVAGMGGDKLGDVTIYAYNQGTVSIYAVF